MPPCYLTHSRPKQFHLLTILYYNRLLKSKRSWVLNPCPLGYDYEKSFKKVIENSQKLANQSRRKLTETPPYSAL